MAKITAEQEILQIMQELHTSRRVAGIIYASRHNLKLDDVIIEKDIDKKASINKK